MVVAISRFSPSPNNNAKPSDLSCSMDLGTTMDISFQDEFDDCPSSDEESEQPTSLLPYRSSALREDSKNERKFKWEAESFFLRKQAPISSPPQPLSGVSSFQNIKDSVSEGLFSRWEAYKGLFTARPLDEPEGLEAALKASEAAWSKPLLSSTVLEKSEKELKGIIELLHKKLRAFHSEKGSEERRDLLVQITSLKKQIEERVVQMNDTFEKSSTYTPNSSSEKAHTLLSELDEKASEQHFIALKGLLLREAKLLGVDDKTTSNLGLIDLYQTVRREAKSKLKIAKNDLQAANVSLETAESERNAAQSTIATRKFDLQSTALKNKKETKVVIAEEKKLSVANESSETVESKHAAAEFKVQKEKFSVNLQQTLLNQIEEKAADVLKTHNKHEAHKALQEQQKKTASPFKRLMMIFFNPSSNIYLSFTALRSLLRESVKRNWNPFA